MRYLLITLLMLTAVNAWSFTPPSAKPEDIKVCRLNTYPTDGVYIRCIGGYQYISDRGHVQMLEFGENVPQPIQCTCD